MIDRLLGEIYFNAKVIHGIAPFRRIGESLPRVMNKNDLYGIIIKTYLDKVFIGFDFSSSGKITYILNIDEFVDVINQNIQDIEYRLLWEIYFWKSDFGASKGFEAVLGDHEEMIKCLLESPEVYLQDRNVAKLVSILVSYEKNNLRLKRSVDPVPQSKSIITKIKEWFL